MLCCQVEGKITDKKNFKGIVLQAVDEGLMVLGNTVRHALYYHAERIYHVKREEVPDRLAAFHEALSSLLGAGARIVERCIAQNLYNKLGLEFEEHEGWTLVDYVNHAKKATEVS